MLLMMAVPTQDAKRIGIVSFNALGRRPRDLHAVLR